MSRMMNNLSGSDRQTPSAPYGGSVSPDLAIASRRAQRAEDHARVLAVERALERIEAEREASLIGPLRSLRNAIGYKERSEKTYRTEIGELESAHRRRMSELGMKYARMIGQIRQPSETDEDEASHIASENERIDGRTSEIDALISLSRKLARVDLQVRNLAYEESGINLADFTALLIRGFDPTHPRTSTFVAEHRGAINALNAIKLMDETPRGLQDLADLKTSVQECRAKASPEFIPLMDYFETNVQRQAGLSNITGLPGFKLNEALTKERKQLERAKKVPAKIRTKDTYETKAKVAEAKAWFTEEKAKLDQELAAERKEIEGRHAADLQVLETMRLQLRERESVLKAELERRLVEEGLHRTIGLNRLATQVRR